MLPGFSRSFLETTPTSLPLAADSTTGRPVMVLNIFFRSSTVVSGVAIVMSVDMMSRSRAPAGAARVGRQVTGRRRRPGNSSASGDAGALKPRTSACKVPKRRAEQLGRDKARTRGRLVLEDVVIEVLAHVLVCRHNANASVHLPALPDELTGQQHETSIALDHGKYVGQEGQATGPSLICSSYAIGCGHICSLTPTVSASKVIYE